MDGWIGRGKIGRSEDRTISYDRKIGRSEDFIRSEDRTISYDRSDRGRERVTVASVRLRSARRRARVSEAVVAYYRSRDGARRVRTHEWRPSRREAARDRRHTSSHLGRLPCLPCLMPTACPCRNRAMLSVCRRPSSWRADAGRQLRQEACCLGSPTPAPFCWRGCFGLVGLCCLLRADG